MNSGRCIRYFVV